MSETDTLCKLMILYMLERVDFPLTSSQISDFILGRDYASYFTLQTVLAELTESRLVRRETIRNSSYYTPTEAGADAVRYFGNRVDAAIRSDIDQYIKDNKMKLRDEVSIISDYYRNTAGEFSVHCVVKEKYANPIELTVTVPDEAQARKACSQWRSQCQEIYEYVMKKLL